MTKKPPIKLAPLTEAQKQLAPAHKRELFFVRYKDVITKMKQLGIKFPFGVGELGIDVTWFATQWVALPDRGPIYKNKLINDRIKKDIKRIGIDSIPDKSITEKKEKELLSRNNKEIGVLNRKNIKLSKELDIAQQGLIEKESEIELLMAKLEKNNIAFEQELKNHKKQFENCLTRGGRTF